VINETNIDLSAILKGNINKEIYNQLPIKELKGFLQKYRQAR